VNSEQYDRQRRWTATATTWLEKAVAILRSNAASASDEVRWLVGHDAGRLFLAATEQANALAGLLNGEDLERAEREAQQLARRLRRARVAGHLDNVEGRTLEEATAFAAKAATLRGTS
jgi:hypothetical protein